MSKLRVVYIISLVLVGVLLTLVFFLPMFGGAEEYTKVQGESLIRNDNGWILQFDILNYEGKGQSYTIALSIDGELSNLAVYIPNEQAFTYVKQINRDMTIGGVVNFSVYYESEDVPFKTATYYLR